MAEHTETTDQITGHSNDGVPGDGSKAFFYDPNVAEARVP